MQISINNKTISFQPAYSKKSTAWKTKNKDAYSFQILEGVPCFIKRSESKPSAWPLLKSIQHKKTINCPDIYETVTTKENGKKIYYYFSQHIEGETVMEAIEQGKQIDIEVLVRDIAYALQFLHKSSYWFSDLNEENIFRGADGHYYLIDLDSCWSNSIQPTYEQEKKGGLPSKSQTFAKGIHQFLIEILNKKKTDFEKLNGINLNYLQLVFIATKLNYYYSHPNFNYTSRNFLTVKLHQYLHNKNPFYSRN